MIDNISFYYSKAVDDSHAQVLADYVDKHVLSTLLGIIKTKYARMAQTQTIEIPGLASTLLFNIIVTRTCPKGVPSVPSVYSYMRRKKSKIQLLIHR